VGQLGFTVVGGALVGYGIGYGIELAGGGKGWRLGGALFGLASGLWAAGRTLSRLIPGKRGDTDT
jgi:hypothetical protein